MPGQDLLNRFLFEDYDIRGEIISLNESYQAIISKHPYPAAVSTLIGEFIAAAGLLSSVLKFDGTLTLQARGQGPLSLIMADCTRHKNLRAIAQYEENNLALLENEATVSLIDLIGTGTLAITIDPANGERYQGIVPLEAENLAGCLEGYFAQSEQLPTKIWLSSNTSSAAGLLLQALPEQKHTDRQQNASYWEHITTLADTISSQEQLTLDHQAQLHRLFHQENLRMFEPQPLAFNCSCSRVRTSSALLSMGEQEVQSILSEEGEITIDCNFCHQVYQYSTEDIAKLFKPDAPTVH